MQAESIHPDQLESALEARWCQLSSQVPGCDSPFLHPIYARTLAHHRPRVEIGLLQERGQVRGFFPFERQRRGTGLPPGNKLCDLQGIVSEPGMEWTLDELLRGCRLNSLHWEHVLASTVPGAEFLQGESEARYLDLSQGYDRYSAARRELGSHRLPMLEIKRRKLTRDYEEPRLVWCDTSRAALASVIDWKRAQRRETGTFDVMQFGWVRDFLAEMQHVRSSGFCGVLNSLYVGDELIAVHLGMYTATALSIWFQAYNRQFAKYSPGSILLIEVAQAAAQRGIGRIELGSGSESWKQSFASAGLPTRTGTWDRRLWRQQAWNAWYWLRQKARPLLTNPTVSVPKRMLRSLQLWSAMRR